MLERNPKFQITFNVEASLKTKGSPVLQFVQADVAEVALYQYYTPALLAMELADPLGFLKLCCSEL